MRPHLLCPVVFTLVGCGGSKPVEDPPTPAPAAAAMPADPEGVAGEARGSVASDLRRTGFDEVPAGKIPEGWTLAETHSAGSPATWVVAEVADAPSPPRAFGVTASTNTGQTYNLALWDGASASDVDVAVMVKVGSGREDQGGGVALRVLGPGDYYIARWNPLERNVKLYVVRDSVRTELAKAEIELETTEWQALRAVMTGPRLELFVNDEPVLSATDDAIPGPGGVGLWTKADAATWFDDLVIQTL
jgi:hypothetical protein